MIITKNIEEPKILTKLMTNNSIHFSSLTFGCKLNQYDTAAIENGLTKSGWIRVNTINQSQALVINTCTVTGKSEREANKLIRRVRKKYPDIFLIVTGCLVESKSKALSDEEFSGADLLFGNVSKYSPLKIINSFNSKQNKKKNNLINNSPTQEEKIHYASTDIMATKSAEFYPVNLFYGNRTANSRSRAFVKIQDGCSLRCSYCIVPFVRGKNRSVSSNIILPYLTNLYKQGYREAVLTGIHIGTYGRDCKTKNSENNFANSLLDLLKRIEKSNNPIKIRLSSLDCGEISDELVKFIGYSKKIQPHLHIPLQSGSDKILRKMNRKYSKRQFLDTIEKLSRINPDIMLGTDIIVGFPGETASDFQETREVLLHSNLSYGHIFSFSPREKTPAFDMTGQLSRDIINSRRKNIQELANQKRKNFYLSQAGKTREAIILQNETKPRVLTDNYLNLSLETAKKEPEPKSLLIVKIKTDKKTKIPYAIPVN